MIQTNIFNRLVEYICSMGNSSYVHLGDEFLVQFVDLHPTSQMVRAAVPVGASLFKLIMEGSGQPGISKNK